VQFACQVPINGINGPSEKGGTQVIASSNGLNAEPIIHSVSESLLASQIFLSRLH